MFKKQQPTAPVQQDPKTRMIMDPAAFNAYVKGLNLEPLEQVKKRYETIKPLEDVPQYVQSGQMAKDVTRLEMETGKVPNKNQPGKFLVNQDPVFIRKMYKPENVIEFYEKDLKGVGKKANIEEFNNRMATLTMISDIKSKLRGFNRYAAVLDEVAWRLGEEPRDRLSDKLYKLSSKLPVDKCAEQIKHLKSIAAKLNDPNYKDPGRETTKGYKTLSEVFNESKGDMSLVLSKIEVLSKANDKDTYKDRMVKQIYRIFLDPKRKQKSADPKGADELVSEITKASQVTQQLIDKIDRYKRTGD
jgi:hypothetical protein